MTRREPADLFATDPETAVLAILERAADALTAGDIKRALSEGGVDEDDLQRAWPAIQKRLRSHEHVAVEPGHRYRWSADGQPVSADVALERLTVGGIPARRREALAALVRRSLRTDEDQVKSTRDKHDVELPWVRALAELSIEVEELATNQASAEALAQRIRARTARAGLDPVDRAGHTTTFDRARHEPLGRPIDDGATVVVVRPGYVWRAPDGDITIARPVVQVQGRIQQRQEREQD